MSVILLHRLLIAATIGARAHADNAAARFTQTTVLVAISSCLLLYILYHQPYHVPFANWMEAICIGSQVAVLALNFVFLGDDPAAAESAADAAYYIMCVAVTAMLLRIIAVMRHVWWTLPKLVFLAFKQIPRWEREKEREKARSDKRRVRRFAAEIDFINQVQARLPDAHTSRALRSQLSQMSPGGGFERGERSRVPGPQPIPVDDESDDELQGGEGGPPSHRQTRQRRSQHHRVERQAIDGRAIFDELGRLDDISDDDGGGDDGGARERFRASARKVSLAMRALRDAETAPPTDPLPRPASFGGFDRRRRHTTRASASVPAFLSQVEVDVLQMQELARQEAEKKRKAKMRKRRQKARRARQRAKDKAKGLQNRPRARRMPKVSQGARPSVRASTLNHHASIPRLREMMRAETDRRSKHKKRRDSARASLQHAARSIALMSRVHPVHQHADDGDNEDEEEDGEGDQDVVIADAPPPPPSQQPRRRRQSIADVQASAKRVAAKQAADKSAAAEPQRPSMRRARSGTVRILDTEIQALQRRSEAGRSARATVQQAARRVSVARRVKPRRRWQGVSNLQLDPSQNVDRPQWRK